MTDNPKDWADEEAEKVWATPGLIRENSPPLSGLHTSGGKEEIWNDWAQQEAGESL